MTPSPANLDYQNCPTSLARGGRAAPHLGSSTEMVGPRRLFADRTALRSFLTVLAALLVLVAPAKAQAQQDDMGYVEGRIISIDEFTNEAIVQLSGQRVVRAELGYDVATGPVEVGLPTFEVGDRVELYFSTGPTGRVRYAVADWVRRPTLLLLTAIFLIVSVVVARFKGLRAFVATGSSLVLIIAFLIPAMIAGYNPILVSMLGVGGILILAIYFVHGVSWSTTAALVGTLAASFVTLILGLVFTELAFLTGYGTEEGMMISFAAGDVDLKGLLLAGLLIGALGALTDITIVQASVVRELAHVNPNFGVPDLFKHGMNVGLDHIGSLVNTLVLAYTGTALPLLVLLHVNDIPWGHSLNLELVAAEVVHTLVGSIGLVLAVPFTTFIAAFMFRGDTLPMKPGELEHGHKH